MYVVGDTGGSFPTTPNATISTSTTSRIVTAEISADGSRFLYSTYLPDTDWDAAAVALDDQGDVYVAGTTTTGHAFVTKLSQSVRLNSSLPRIHSSSHAITVVHA